jgi:hypothetical protein
MPPPFGMSFYACCLELEVLTPSDLFGLTPRDTSNQKRGAKLAPDTTSLTVHDCSLAIQQLPSALPR